jgi:hypothetical protein
VPRFFFMFGNSLAPNLLVGCCSAAFSADHLAPSNAAPAASRRRAFASSRGLVRLVGALDVEVWLLLQHASGATPSTHSVPRSGTPTGHCRTI